MNSQQEKYDRVRQTLRRDWRNDNAILSQYFIACADNWKIYSGPRTQKQAARLHGIYKQATVGDNPWVKTPQSSKERIEKEEEWLRLKGMPQDMAKRRFITYLAEIDPLLIDVMPSEKPPIGFPTDRKGRLICAKCNTAVGCQRPIMDMHKMQLRMKLLENESLHEAEKVQQFVDEAMEGHQCMWGVHTFIHKADAKPFADWFNLPENQGFSPYNYTPLFAIVKDLVAYHFEIAWDMQQHKSEYSVDDMNAQLIKTRDLKVYYEQLTGEEFLFNVPCTRDTEVCNSRRAGSKGVNHTHPAELDEPSFDKPSFADLIRLRDQCVQLGIKPEIGIETDIGKRCKIYQERILAHFDRLKKSVAAKEKNDARADVHRKEKNDILRTSIAMSKRQVWEASNVLSLSQIENLMKKRVNLNTESARGQTPLIAIALIGAPSDMFDRAIRAGADQEFINKYGYTALMVACRRRDAAAMHALLKHGASALTSSPDTKLAAIHHCAYYGLETETQILYDYVKAGAGDSLKVVSFLNAKTKSGDTALIIAARRRNNLMCKFLLSLGADPKTRNLAGKTAATTARECGWVELAEWLGTKIGGGIKKVETVFESQMERRLRFGMMNVRDKIRDFVQEYITLLYGSHFAQHVNTCPLGTPAWVHELNHEKISLKDKFALLAENQYRLIYAPVANHRYDSIKAVKKENDLPSPAKPTNKPKGLPRSVTSLNKIHWEPEVVELRLMCREMLAVVQKGDAAPDTEGNRPRPWTTLMCAAAINDTDTMKRLLREGADVNCGNKSGTTALMLAAQLNVVDSVAFLLQNGADIDQVDLHGYTAIAYATSIPLPIALSESFSSYVSDGDTEFIKRLSAEKLLKLAASYGTKGLDSVLDDNVLETGEDEKAEWARYQALLESHGLSRIETNWQLQNSIKNSSTRLGYAANEKFQAYIDSDNESETASEIAERDAYMQMLEVKRLEREEKERTDALRCPICTLLTPCSHFLNPNTLKKLIEGGYKPPPKGSIIRDGSALTKRQISFLTERVLREAGLNDRNTDRTVDTLRAYQKRIVQLNKEKQMLLLEAADHATSEENEAEAVQLVLAGQAQKRIGPLTAISDAQELVAKEWRQDIDDNGRIIFTNSNSQESWTMHIDIIDGEATAYYHNSQTDETKWEPPGSLAGLSLDVLASSFPPSHSEAFHSNDTTNELIDPLSALAALEMSGSASEVEDKPKKKKKKGGVKFSFAEDAPMEIPVDSSSTTLLNDTAQRLGEVPDVTLTTSTPVSSISASSASVDPNINVDVTTTAAPDISGSLNSSGTLVSALKIGDGEGTKKKKKRVGGIRFHETNNSEAVTVEVRLFSDDRKQFDDGDIYLSDTVTPTTAMDSEADRKPVDSAKQPEDQTVKEIDAIEIGAISTEESASIESAMDVQDNDPQFLVTDPKGSIEASTVQEMSTADEAIGDGVMKGQSDKATDTPLVAIEELCRPPVQPLPPNERKVFTFTKNTSLGVSTVDNILPAEILPTIRMDTNVSAKDLNKKKHIPPASILVKSTGQQPSPPASHHGDFPVFISGWTFSGIAVPSSHPSVISRGFSDFSHSGDDADEDIAKPPFSLTNFHNERKSIASDVQVAPVEGVNVSVESWGIALEYIRGIMMKDILPIIDFHCVVETKTWHVINERCPLCRLGIVRYRSGSSSSKEASSEALATLVSSYCVTCAVRCMLYNKIRKCIPRSQKARLAKDWPVYLPPKFYPLERGERTPIHHALSRDNLELLAIATDIVVPPSPKLNKYEMALVGRRADATSPPRSPLSFAARVRSSSPSPTPGTSPKTLTFSSNSRATSPFARNKSPPKGQPSTAHVRILKSQASTVIANMLNRENDSDDGRNDDNGSVGKNSKSSSKMFSKTARSPDKSRNSTTLKSKTMPAFMKNFHISGIAKDNVYEIFEPQEPEPDAIPDMNLETRYGPQELALIPFLIAKGQYDEVERLLRVAMCLEDLQGESGANHTATVLTLQADMYMQLDLFPLAMGLYMDCIDIIVSSLGFEDERFVQAVYKLIACSRMMGLSDEVVDVYMGELSAKLEGSLVSSKQAMAESIDKLEVRCQKHQALLDNVYLQVKQFDRQLHSNSDHRQMVSSIKGLISFVNVLESPNGLASSARVMFVQYCCSIPFTPLGDISNVGVLGKNAPRTYGPIAQFIIACCRIRLCLDPEVYRFLLQNLVQKFLSKHENLIGILVPDCGSIITAIRAVVTEKLETKGRPPGIEEFDPLLKKCILFLYQENLYSNFLRSSSNIKKIVIDDFLDAEAEFIHISVVLIQSFWRQKYMKWQVDRRRANRRILKMMNENNAAS